MALSSLLWKNLLLKRRHWRATLLEVVFPLVIIVILTILRTVVPSVHVPAGWSTSSHFGNHSKTRGTSFNLYDPHGATNSTVLFTPQVPKFAFPELTFSGLLLALAIRSLEHGIQLGQLSATDLAICQHRMLFEAATSVDDEPNSSFAVPQECHNKVMPYKIAIVPDTTFTRRYFLETLKQWYPRVQVVRGSSDGSSGGDGDGGFQIPPLEQSVKFFESNDALDNYIKNNKYGLDLNHTRIFGAIVFNKYPTSDDAIGKFQTMDYSLRLNATWTDNFETNDVPRTVGDPVPYQAFARKLDTSYISRYALNGFMTLQTLVTRFVTCMPEWDAATKTTTGKCQRPQSTAKASPQVIDKLRGALNGDLVLKYALEQFSQSPNASTSIPATSVSMDRTSLSTSKLSSILSPESEQVLLRPLFQAPQPLGQAIVAPFPIDNFTGSAFYDYVKNLFSLDIVVCYILIVAKILVVFINEKETRMREFMKIVGVKENTIVLSWYVVYALLFVVISLLQTAISHIGLFKSSNVVLLFLYFYLFGLATLAYCYCISAMFSKARTGALVGVVLYFIMNSLSNVIKTQTSEQIKLVASLLPPIAVGFGAQVLSELESNSIGVNFDNWTANVFNLRFVNVLVMLLVDFVLYTVLGLYLERVIPKDYGTTLKWYFPLQPSYWYRWRRSRGKNDMVIRTDPESDVALDVNPNVEPVSEEFVTQEHRGEALRIQRLQKVFTVHQSEKLAVKNMNLTMYKNQITCLLGHNGAGKTTLISMLTGMTTVSSGDAHFQGLSITQDMDTIRESLGICFQHDALYPELTVEEHLLFFARLKGYRESALKEVVSKQIQDVGLTEKRCTQSKALSGGMKRKLSVAIALLGDSSLVFLDEPTSGMDPYSRRSTWEILMNNRRGRVMVLTTHFMDEADILGDRIAIMSEGELRCCGSSLFLKNRFGAGYNLTFVKADNGENVNSVADRRVINFIKSYVPHAQVLSNVGAELAFQLPLESSKHFAAMFSELDGKLNQLGVSSYGISVTTLEEVFIKVAELADDEYETNQHTLLSKHDTATIHPMDHIQNGIPAHSNITIESAASEISSVRLTGLRAFTNQLKALLLKRFHYSRRDKKMFYYGLILPIMCMVISFSICYSNSMLKSDPLKVLNTATSDLPGGSQGLTPLVCQVDQGNWCNEVMTKHFTGSSVIPLSLASPYFGSDSPEVFGVTYNNPPIEANGTTGACLATGQQVYERGYKQTVKNQFGAYVVQASSDSNTFGYNLLVNSTSIHSAAIFKTLMDQALYRFFASQKTASEANGAQDLDLIVNTYPLPYTNTSTAVLGSFMSLFACFFLVIAFGYYPVGIVIFIVKEKEASHNSKHQQCVSGVSLFAFWLANYLWDLVTYACVAGVAIVLIEAFKVQALTGKGCITCTSSTFPAVILLFVLFGLAIIPYTYCLSYLFKEHASSQTYTVVLNYLFGLILLLMSYNMAAFESTKKVNDVLIYFWRLSPLFNLGNGVLTLSYTEYKSNFDPSKKDPFSGDQIGYELLYLACTSVLYSSLAVGIDYAMTFPAIRGAFGGGCCKNRRKLKQFDNQQHDEDHDVMDEDVRREAQRVTSRGESAWSGQCEDILQLQNLRKVYEGGKKVAVHDLCFGLKKGECFGFLGINGAGKTTTMRMLTGDEVPTSGNARIADFDILSDHLHIRQLIGYCPQFDALFELLTVREHLELFARIKGLAGEILERVVQQKMVQLNLVDFEHKLAGTLSGGNKRKLSVAIALIGEPRIVFLDEPSTGMDPVSRRFMWNVIAQESTQSKNSTVLLTTHSMEESEALCSRVGIMVGGRLRCLGSVQHLKSRFGNGFVLDVKLGDLTKKEINNMVHEHGFNDMISKDQVASACEQLGDSSFTTRLTEKHPTGFMLHAALERDGFVHSDALCSWFIAESRFERLFAYLKQSLGDTNVALLERQNDLCRFKLAAGAAGVSCHASSSPRLRLSRVFAIVEQMKDQLDIHEYSVCQTTLEQIFNAFASQQREEQGVARGVVQ